MIAFSSFGSSSEDETFHASVVRRIEALQEVDDYSKSIEVLNRIVEDIKNLVPKETISFVHSLRMKKWPCDNKNTCHIFNSSFCARHPVHRGEKDRGKNFVHNCWICMAILGVGFFHTAMECSLVKLADDELTSKAFRKSLSA